MRSFRKEEDIVRPHGMGNRGIADKGLIDLAYRSGEILIIQAHAVYENDEFSYEFGLEPKLTHKPAVKDRGEPICFYAMFKTKDGGYGFDVMSVDDVRAHAAKYSKSYNSSFSPWRSNFVEMSLKTVLKRCIKFAPLRSDFVRGVAQDETIHTTIGSDMTLEESRQIESEGSVSENAEYVDTATGEVTPSPEENESR